MARRRISSPRRGTRGGARLPRRANCSGDIEDQRGERNTCACSSISLPLPSGACRDRAARPAPQDKFITVASTTSTEQSGLFGYLLPLFQEKTGIEVRVVAQGTGQALETARRGDARRGLRARPRRREGVRRRGRRRRALRGDVQRLRRGRPGGRPGRHQGRARTSRTRWPRSQRPRRPFASRGDDSGTHKKPSWSSGRPPASTGPRAATGTARPARAWARPSTPPSADAAYTLTDRGTWISFENKGRARDPRRGRPDALQPVRRDPGEPGKASAREADGGPGLHRLAHLGRRPDAPSPATRFDDQQLFYPNAKAVGG